VQHTRTQSKIRRPNALAVIAVGRWDSSSELAPVQVHRPKSSASSPPKFAGQVRLHLGHAAVRDYPRAPNLFLSSTAGGEQAAACPQLSSAERRTSQTNSSNCPQMEMVRWRTCCLLPSHWRAGLCLTRAQATRAQLSLSLLCSSAASTCPCNSALRLPTARISPTWRPPAQPPI